jgi:hypothetical protein
MYYIMENLREYLGYYKIVSIYMWLITNLRPVPMKYKLKKIKAKGCLLVADFSLQKQKFSIAAVPVRSVHGYCCE